jgi:FMN phosphatase YigB (HAD superfamily)
MPDLRDARVLSVDVFDTLLLRAVPRPVDTFPLVAAFAHDRGWLQAHVTPAQFATVRQTAEADARRHAHQRRGSHEVSLDEIYRMMPPAWFPCGIEPLPRAELDATCEVTYANQAVLALVREARGRGVPVVLTSDTYFSEADLKVLLRRSDIEPEWFAHLVVSSEYGVSKHEGGLFTRLCALYPLVPATAIHHLGDHPHSDVQQALRAGVTATLYDNGQPALGPAARLETLRYGSVLPALHSLRALATRIDAPDDTERRWWFSLGAAHLGPALAAFAEWTLDECTRDGIGTVRPLMREGALFATLIARAAAARGLDLDVAPLHASRGATWLAGLDAFDDAAIATLLQRSHLTVREALQAVGLSPGDAVEPLDEFADTALSGAATTRTRHGQLLHDVLRSTLQAPALQARIASRMAEERGALRAYLEHACGSAETVALVDLGFHGSTGRAIAAATRAASSRRYVQLLVFGSAGLRHAWARG